MGARIRGGSCDRSALPAPLDSGDVAERFDRGDRVRCWLCARYLGDCHVSNGRHARGNDQPTLAIVTHGVYRFTRNPIYLGMVLGQTGLAIGFDSLWILGTLIPYYLVLRYGVVAREEAYLARKFGGVYLDYKSRVRRWL